MIMTISKCFSPDKVQFTFKYVLQTKEKPIVRIIRGS